MDLNLDGKRVIVTGGSRGIGRATVELLANEGCSVAFCARGAEGVAQTTAALKTRGANVVGTAVDVADADAYRRWLADAVAGLGGLDILICNATGYARPGEDGFRNTLEIDLLGLVRAVEATLPALEASGTGSIVALSSTTALDIYLPGAEAYGALKAAVIHYASALARAHGSKGVRCNSIAPGPIEFEGNVWRRRHNERDPVYEAMITGSPLGRLGTAEEVARAVAFLASPAASWINGANLVIDGGLSSRVDF